MLPEVSPIAFTSFRTERLLLRPLEPDDRRVFLKFEEASAHHFAPWAPDKPGHETPDQFFDRQLKRCLDGLASGAGLRLIGVDPASGEIVGRFNLNNINRGCAQYADAGWNVGLPFLNQGYATEGVRALLDIAFASPPGGLALHRVQANIIPENTRSLRVAAKCGFRIEGLGKAMLHIGGAWRDHVNHAKLSSEHRPESPR